ncbi:MAG: fumarylacetoacetate hydrolase family protein [Janthinobacterium lividum]
MKLARIKRNGVVQFAIVSSDHVIALEPPATIAPDAAQTSLLALLTDQVSPLDVGWKARESLPLEAVRLLAPVGRPGKIVGVGRNYLDHASEMAVEIPAVPKMFLKWPGAVIGPDDDIHHTHRIKQLDHEVEVALVIGKPARDVTREHAGAYIAGLTILNDVSERAIQMMPNAPSTSLAKSLDTFCPMGPWLVTLDEIGSIDDITLECHVNGERVQHGHTSQMIFSMPVLVEYLSHLMTLEPGDVIATGTPSGVGMYRTPPVWLQPGDTVSLRVSGIGTLTNKVVSVPTRTDS